MQNDILTVVNNLNITLRIYKALHDQDSSSNQIDKPAPATEDKTILHYPIGNTPRAIHTDSNSAAQLRKEWIKYFKEIKTQTEEQIAALDRNIRKFQLLDTSKFQRKRKSLERIAYLLGSTDFNIEELQKILTDVLLPDSK